MKDLRASDYSDKSLTYATRLSSSTVQRLKAKIRRERERFPERRVTTRAVVDKVLNLGMDALEALDDSPDSETRDEP